MQSAERASDVDLPLSAAPPALLTGTAPALGIVQAQLGHGISSSRRATGS